MSSLRELLREKAPSPQRCDLCGRFVSSRDWNLSHEWGDYGSILSTELLCPKCASPEPSA